MSIKCHKSDDKPILGRVQSALHGTPGRSGPWVCWLPATPAMVANEFRHARSMRSMALEVSSVEQTATSPLQTPSRKTGSKTVL
ncbi:hypothetical protein Y032_0466g1971 [Ancylostoma ceylanicum]|uniref:Uncharacterized protein n=1 Tax=Ancylostoma ceylanicum TaxID=53326 RepID=A0A016WYC9_9BILA|nr:hypothetical protein Y032_0466g1971 [Ancylostoma ceylanicum]